LEGLVFWVGMLMIPDIAKEYTTFKTVGMKPSI
jgi:hypothetical protein